MKAAYRSGVVSGVLYSSAFFAWIAFCFAPSNALGFLVISLGLLAGLRHQAMSQKKPVIEIQDRGREAASSTPERNIA
jgi:hypothetical protein